MPHGLTPTGRSNSRALRRTAQYGRAERNADLTKRDQGTSRLVPAHC